MTARESVYKHLINAKQMIIQAFALLATKVMIWQMVLAFTLLLTLPNFLIVVVKSGKGHSASVVLLIGHLIHLIYVFQSLISVKHIILNHAQVVLEAMI